MSPTGNRQPLPANPDKVCASCAKPRGNIRRGWEPITRAGVVIGWTCPACPRVDEPIRRRVAKSGAVSFRVTVDATTPGDAKRRQITRVVGTLDVARATVVEIRQGVQSAASRSGTYVDPSRFTVRDIADKFFDNKDGSGVRECTANGYRSSLSSLLRHMGQQTAREVTPDDIERVLRKLAKDGGRGGRGLSHRSIGYALGTLRQVYRFARRNGWVLTDPAADAVMPLAAVAVPDDAADAKVKRWTPAQLVRFRTEADTYGEGEGFAREPWLTAGQRLTLCGLRRSEVLGLDWTNVDMDSGTVRVRASRTKTGRGSATATAAPKVENAVRTVAVETLHPGTVRALKALWLQQGRPASGLVIQDAVGEPVHPDLFSRRFVALCKLAGVPVLSRIHNVRHSIATALQAAGVPDHEAAALLGHDVLTYRRFYLVTDDAAASSAAAVGGKVFAAVL